VGRLVAALVAVEYVGHALATRRRAVSAPPEAAAA
jgi:hypothetical protein